MVFAAAAPNPNPYLFEFAVDAAVVVDGFFATAIAAVTAALVSVSNFLGGDLAGYLKRFILAEAVAGFSAGFVIFVGPSGFAIILAEPPDYTPPKPEVVDPFTAVAGWFIPPLGVDTLFWGGGESSRCSA